MPKPKNVFQSPVVHKAGLNPGLTAAAALLVLIGMLPLPECSSCRPGDGASTWRANTAVGVSSWTLYICKWLRRWLWLRAGSLLITA